MTPELAPGIVEASGVLVGLVIVAILTIRASSSQAKASSQSMERVVELMAKSLRDDLRAYQGQMHTDSRATMVRVEALDNRMTEIARAVNDTRKALNSAHDNLDRRLKSLEVHHYGTPSRPAESIQ